MLRLNLDVNLAVVGVLRCVGELVSPLQLFIGVAGDFDTAPGLQCLFVQSIRANALEGEPDMRNGFVHLR